MIRIPPFSELSTSELDQLADQVTSRKIPAKQLVFSEGEVGDSAYLIVSGRVALFKSSPNNKELIIELVSPNELCGVVVLFCPGPYPLSARTQIASELVVITRVAAKPLLDNNPAFNEALVWIIRNRMTAAQNLARALAHDHVGVRVASVLTSLLPTDGEGHTMQIELSRTEVADLAGITIETASRVMKAFERQSIVDLSSQGVIRINDVARLRQITDR